MKKFFGLLAILLAIAGCAGNGAETAGSAPQGEEVPLSVSWGQDGYGDGFIVKPVAGGAGQFRLRVYYKDPFSTSSTGVVNRCFGHWDAEAAEGSAGQAGSAGGYWRINCASGLSAEGAFVMDETGNGVGEGLDHQGHAVRLQFGKTAAQPSS